jgi:hypothetical protein
MSLSFHRPYVHFRFWFGAFWVPYFDVSGAASCERCLCLVDLYSCLSDVNTLTNMAMYICRAVINEMCIYNLFLFIFNFICNLYTKLTCNLMLSYLPCQTSQLSIIIIMYFCICSLPSTLHIAIVMYFVSLLADCCK